MRLAQILLLSLLIGSFLYDSLAAEETGKKWALLVGVDQYAKIGGLEFAGNDQRAFAEELARLGIPRDQIFLLHDVAKETRYLPFRENVERQLELLTKLVRPGDMLIFGFSGHGVHIDGRSYLCPTEADFDRAQQTLISLDSVFAKLGKCQASLKVMFVDACRNDPRPKGSRGRSDPLLTASFSESLENPPNGLVLFTSCGAGQTSKEDDKLQHGVFMYHVLEGLQGKAANGQGLITLNSLYDYASLNTKKYVAQRWNEYQSPALKGEIDGAFELARVDPPKKNKIPTVERERQISSDALTGWWSGKYYYPARANRQPVGFSYLVIQDGTAITGFVKERNTFGKNNDPYLHASFRGSHDENSLKFSFRKTYDGTSDIDHDVLYWGSMSGDETRVREGSWQIKADWGASFTLSKDTSTSAGKYSGVWAGTKYYPESSSRAPVKFSMIVVHKGEDLIGLIKERRVSGGGGSGDPWLHATAYARVDEAENRMTIFKSYDGTAGVTGKEEYEGTFSDEEDDLVLTGIRKSDGEEIGTFTLVRAPSLR